MRALEEILKHRFANPALLQEALTRPGLARTKEGLPFNYQRLEFLGDAVLGVVVAEMLFTLYKQESEGDLARRHASLVRMETLLEVAVEIDLGQFMEGAKDTSGLADACEAILGALYLDGGIEAAKNFIFPYWEKLARASATPPKDAKTSLQEWAQGRGLGLPRYTVAQQEGPAHAPNFTVRVELAGEKPAEASAANKRMAEQLAAQTLLERLSKSA